jgi:acid phosphatase
MACPCSEIKQPNPEKEDLDGEAGLKFSHSKEFATEFESALASARAACTKHIGEPSVAVVSDIDETLLDNRPAFEETKGLNIEKFNEWVNQAQAKTLPTSKFLQWARQKGFAVVLITGRDEEERRVTIENLVRNSISYDGLYMRPAGDHSLAEEMKTQYRKQIEAMGFKIIVSIGDQDSDLYGGYAEDCEKLPNKIYYIP